MAIDQGRGVGYRRLAGIYDWLLDQQSAAVIKPDLRRWDWSLEDSAAIAADRAAVEAEARAHPPRSTLLDKLLLGEPVIVGRTDLIGRLPVDGPLWLLDGCGHVKVYPDDLVEPCDGPADQRLY